MALNILKNSSIELDAVIEAMRSKGYSIEEEVDRSLNIVGIRRRPLRVDAFNDVLFVFYPLRGQWQYQKFQITTIPGRAYLAQKLGNERGTAILVPGHYIDMYSVREHSGSSRHQALCQKHGTTLPVYRDARLDGVPDLDPSKIENNGTGINLHRASPVDCTISVGEYSAGCQTFRCTQQFAAFMALVRSSAGYSRNEFTYTLMDEGDLQR